MPRQLTFDLPSLTSHDRGDFFVSQSNEMAVRFIEDWEAWPSKKLILFGPKSAGKTHLAHVWKKMSGARVVSAKSLKYPEEASRTNLLVEDVHEIAGLQKSEAALLHTHNLLNEKGYYLLMTGLNSPRQWGIQLQDLASRIEGASHGALCEPDDLLFSSLLAKQFADRQLFPTPNVLQYIVFRLERSHEATRRFVELADKASMRERHAITRAFAKRILAQLEEVSH